MRNATGGKIWGLDDRLTDLDYAEERKGIIIIIFLNLDNHTEKFLSSNGIAVLHNLSILTKNDLCINSVFFHGFTKAIDLLEFIIRYSG